MFDDIANSNECLAAIGQYVLDYQEARQKQPDFDHIDAIRVGFRAGYEYGCLS